ncbi:MAG TPA: LTA synthase family protein [Nitrospira sp.]|nr:LTA synthase family protein [Nitrospira sp.]
MLKWSFKQSVVFWWLLFVVIQQVERYFLLPEVMAVEVPSADVFVKTFMTGFRADLITSSIAILLICAFAGLSGTLWWGWTRARKRQVQAETGYRRSLVVAGMVMALLLVVLLLVDIGYYHFNQQRLNFVFFEYVGDLMTQWTETGLRGSQAAEQTGAELHDRGKWAGMVAAFLLLQATAITAWWFSFTRLVKPTLSWLGRGGVPAPNVILFMGFVGGVTGFHHQGPYAIRLTDISSTAYYMLAQNPILYASDGVRAAFEARGKSDGSAKLDAMPLKEAVSIAQEVLGQGAVFPYPEYPFVQERLSVPGVQFKRQANVLMILVEGLDRRFLNKTVANVRVTPFLDHLKEDSLYFEHFFANGVQTARGLFSTFCSYYPRQGTAAMKTRYMHDYVCIPSLLREHGYRTEMVIGYHRDINRLHLFMSRNGLHQLFDRSDFPPGIEEIGMSASVGKPDGALLDLVRTRVESLRARGNPYFLAAMTIGMHHPFAVPLTHPDIQALKAEPDGYIAALRYLDLELERVLTGMKRDGLLKDTVVLILGDHGRHEKVGQTDFEKQAGHFMTPLFLWVDDSLREPGTYRPRTVMAVASQVDLLPTILGLNGVAPRLSPSMGHDLSCLLVSDCMQDNMAFLSSVYDDLIGMADRDGLIFYSLRSETLRSADLDLRGAAVPVDASEPAIALRYRRMLALYVSANTILNQNKIWSWKEFGNNL